MADSFFQGATIPMFVFGRLMLRHRCVNSGKRIHSVDKPSKRQEEKLDYQNSLKKKYAAFPEIRKIARQESYGVQFMSRHRHLPKVLKKMKDKEENRKKKDKPVFNEMQQFQNEFVKQTRKTTEGSIDPILAASLAWVSSSW